MSMIPGLVEYTKEARKAWAMNPYHKISAVARFVVVMTPQVGPRSKPIAQQIQLAIRDLPGKAKKVYIIMRQPSLGSPLCLYYVNKVIKRMPGNRRAIHQWLNAIDLTHANLQGKFDINAFNRLISADGVPTFRSPRRLTEDTLISWNMTDGAAAPQNKLTFHDLDAARIDVRNLLVPNGGVPHAAATEDSWVNNPTFMAPEINESSPLLGSLQLSAAAASPEYMDISPLANDEHIYGDYGIDRQEWSSEVPMQPNSLYGDPASASSEYAHLQGVAANRVPAGASYDHLAPRSLTPPPVLSEPPTKNPYSLYQADGFLWGDGDFAIDLDRYVKKKSNLPAQALDYLNIGFYGCQGVNHLLYGAPARTVSHVNGWFPSVIGQLLSRKSTACGCGTPALPAGVIEDRLMHCNFNLGDSFYHYGVTDPLSPLFKTSFSYLFRHVPNWCVLGNHDYNIHGSFFKFTMFHPLTNKADRPAYQVAHSYLTKQQEETGQARQNVKPGCTDTNDQWNMPYRYYILISKDTKTVFFCIDSNMFVFDQVQQRWLMDVYAKTMANADFANYKKILISHHPFEYYTTKRAQHCEMNKYRDHFITPETTSLSQEVKLLRSDGTSTMALPLPQYNTIGSLLKYFVEINNLRFNALFAAHEHLLSHSKVRMQYTSLATDQGTAPTVTNAFIDQFISGGGGAQIHKVKRNDIYSFFPGVQFSAPKSKEKASYAFVEFIDDAGNTLPANDTIQNVPARIVYALMPAGDGRYSLYFYENFPTMVGDTIRRTPQVIATFSGGDIENFRRVLSDTAKIVAKYDRKVGCRWAVLNNKQLQAMRYLCNQSNDDSPYIAERWGYMTAKFTEQSISVDLWEYDQNYRAEDGRLDPGFVSTNFEVMPRGVPVDWRQPLKDSLPDFRQGELSNAAAPALPSRNVGRRNSRGASANEYEEVGDTTRREGERTPSPAHVYGRPNNRPATGGDTAAAGFEPAIVDSRGASNPDLMETGNDAERGEYVAMVTPLGGHPGIAAQEPRGQDRRSGISETSFDGEEASFIN